ncbi:MAG: hypothetical protein AAGE99_04700 [Chlamydiota bacterium]
MSETVRDIPKVSTIPARPWLTQNICQGVMANEPSYSSNFLAAGDPAYMNEFLTSNGDMYQRGQGTDEYYKTVTVAGGFLYTLNAGICVVKRLTGNARNTLKYRWYNVTRGEFIPTAYAGGISLGNDASFFAGNNTHSVGYIDLSEETTTTELEIRVEWVEYTGSGETTTNLFMPGCNFQIVNLLNARV